MKEENKIDNLIDYLKENMVTKSYLDERVKGFVTKEHFDKQVSALATKKDLDNGFEQLAISTAKGFEEAKQSLLDTEGRLSKKIDTIDTRVEICEDEVKVIKTHLRFS